jgi:SAM-dependent methyltransferase
LTDPRHPTRAASAIAPLLALTAIAPLLALTACAGSSGPSLPAGPAEPPAWHRGAGGEPPRGAEAEADGDAGDDDHADRPGHGHADDHADPGYRPPAGHHHGHHRFDDAERWAAHFEDPARDVWQRPDAVVTALGLAPSARVADIGAATGYFPVRLARAVPEGRVWGVDIEPDMVRYLNERARREGLANLFAVLGTAADPLLPEPVDLVLVVNTYHHIEDRSGYFGRLRQHLRPGGRLAIVDFRMGDLPVGPPEAMKVPPEQVRAELESAGYRLVADDTGLLPHQYLLVFEAAAAPATGP